LAFAGSATIDSLTEYLWSGQLIYFATGMALYGWFMMPLLLCVAFSRKPFILWFADDSALRMNLWLMSLYPAVMRVFFLLRHIPEKCLVQKSSSYLTDAQGN
jgi:hypothetical protein